LRKLRRPRPHGEPRPATPREPVDTRRTRRSTDSPAVPMTVERPVEPATAEPISPPPLEQSGTTATRKRGTTPFWFNAMVKKGSYPFFRARQGTLAVLLLLGAIGALFMARFGGTAKN